MTLKRFLIFTFVTMSILAHFCQLCWHMDLKKGFEVLYTQINVINDAAIKTAKILDEHLNSEIERAGGWNN